MLVAGVSAVVFAMNSPRHWRGFLSAQKMSRSGILLRTLLQHITGRSAFHSVPFRVSRRPRARRAEHLPGEFGTETRYRLFHLGRR